MFLDVPSASAPGSSHSPVVPRRFPYCICRRCWQGWGLKFEFFAFLLAASMCANRWSMMILCHLWAPVIDQSWLQIHFWDPPTGDFCAQSQKLKALSDHEQFYSLKTWFAGCEHTFWTSGYFMFHYYAPYCCNCRCRTLLGQCGCWWPDHYCGWIQGQDCSLDHAKVHQITQDIRSTYCTLHRHLLSFKYYNP